MPVVPAKRQVDDAIFGVQLLDGGASAFGIALIKDFLQIAQQ